jgi:hypothetical protein
MNPGDIGRVSGPAFGSYQQNILRFEPKMGMVLCWVEIRQILPDWYKKVTNSPDLSIFNKIGPTMVEVKSIEITSTKLERTATSDALFVVINDDNKLKFRINIDGDLSYSDKVTPEVFARAVKAELSDGKLQRIYFTDIDGLLTMVKSEIDVRIELLNKAASLLVDCARVASSVFETEKAFLEGVLETYKKIGI